MGTFHGVLCIISLVCVWHVIFHFTNNTGHLILFRNTALKYESLSDKEETEERMKFLEDAP